MDRLAAITGGRVTGCGDFRTSGAAILGLVDGLKNGPKPGEYNCSSRFWDRDFDFPQKQGFARQFFLRASFSDPFFRTIGGAEEARAAPGLAVVPQKAAFRARRVFPLVSVPTDFREKNPPRQSARLPRRPNRDFRTALLHGSHNSAIEPVKSGLPRPFLRIVHDSFRPPVQENRL